MYGDGYRAGGHETLTIGGNGYGLDGVGAVLAQHKRLRVDRALSGGLGAICGVIDGGSLNIARDGDGLCCIVCASRRSNDGFRHVR